MEFKGREDSRVLSTVHTQRRHKESKDSSQKDRKVYFHLREDSSFRLRVRLNISSYTESECLSRAWVKGTTYPTIFVYYKEQHNQWRDYRRYYAYTSKLLCSMLIVLHVLSIKEHCTYLCHGILTVHIMI